MSEHCLIKKNTPELRKKLEDAGLSVCICTTFEDADWLSCWGSHMSYDVHGVYPDDHVVITKNPNPHLTTLEDLKDLNKRYLYREGQKILTPFGIETIKEIIRTHSKQRGYEWLILVEENGNQYTPFELNGIVVKELTLEQWNQIIE